MKIPRAVKGCTPRKRLRNHDIRSEPLPRFISAQSAIRDGESSTLTEGSTEAFKDEQQRVSRLEDSIALEG